MANTHGFERTALVLTATELAHRLTKACNALDSPHAVQRQGHSYWYAYEAVKLLLLDLCDGDADLRDEVHEALLDESGEGVAYFVDAVRERRARRHAELLDYSYLNEPTERDWLTNVTPSAVRDNAHRIYDFMAESGLPPESVIRELAFTKAASLLGISYGVLYDAWLSEQPVAPSDDQGVGGDAP